MPPLAAAWLYPLTYASTGAAIAVRADEVRGLLEVAEVPDREDRGWAPGMVSETIKGTRAHTIIDTPTGHFEVRESIPEILDRLANIAQIVNTP